ncbi:MAG: hypothetical protein EBZ48_16490 [Proteobacteria bacterium]|nr:hypothetical protein [Pseudomonadota bacterium]
MRFLGTRKNKFLKNAAVLARERANRARQQQFMTRRRGRAMTEKEVENAKKAWKAFQVALRKAQRQAKNVGMGGTERRSMRLATRNNAKQAAAAEKAAAAATRKALANAKKAEKEAAKRLKQEERERERERERELEAAIAAEGARIEAEEALAAARAAARPAKTSAERAANNAEMARALNRAANTLSRVTLGSRFGSVNPKSYARSFKTLRNSHSRK